MSTQPLRPRRAAGTVGETSWDRCGDELESVDLVLGALEAPYLMQDEQLPDGYADTETDAEDQTDETSDGDELADQLVDRA